MASSQGHVKRESKMTSSQNHQGKQRNKASYSESKCNGSSSSADEKQHFTKAEPVTRKQKSSDNLPSKQRRRHASRSLNYNDCSNPGDPVSNHYGDDDYHGDDDYYGDSDGDVCPINGFYNNSYVSSSEDVSNLGSQTSLTSANPLEQNVYQINSEEKEIWGLSCGRQDTALEEEKFKADFQGKQSSPKQTTHEEQSVDDLIAEVLAELLEEDKCEADMQAGREELPSKMESEGLLLRKHEMENYAIRARDR